MESELRQKEADRLAMAIVIARHNALQFFAVFNQTRRIKDFKHAIKWFNKTAAHWQKLEELLGKKVRIKGNTLIY